eukprot:GHVU01002899.1.p1 GENE.GHVU01002899.1~~GHVU01002899.1.p1  ORF type:complete len:406 (+),score=37.46 GHVU01002899.1:414-1631(+)
MNPDFDYDFAVIGGGSGGLAAAKEAASLGAKTVLFDFVKPSTQGTKWGLGGTCVNVGCVPKKLMHYASQAGGPLRHDAEAFGWLNESQTSFNWEKCVQTVQNHVKMLNFSYRGGLRSAKVEYINALASFEGPHKICFRHQDQDKVISAAHILIAVGGRPIIPADIPGAQEHAITSDDIFSLQRVPGKTLVVGASYIALECAGFLCEMGFEVAVAVRSILLRGFDRQCSEKVGKLMAECGVRFLQSTLPSSMSKAVNGRIQVAFSDGKVDEFDTVVYATGRYPDTKGLNLAEAGVATTAKGKVDARDEVTNVPHIYAVGDILEGRPELTPVAIRCGTLLAKRIFGNSSEKMNWDIVATTIFTPFEYGAIGLTEEETIRERRGVLVGIHASGTLRRAPGEGRKPAGE